MANLSMKKADIFVVLLIVPMCLYVFYESARWPEAALIGNPLLIPRLVAGCLLIAAAILLFRALTGRARILESRLQSADLRRVLAVAVLTGGYVFAVERVGFITVTFFFLLFFGWVLGERRWARLIIFAVAVPIAVYIIFDTTLHVPLPRGWFR